MEGISDIKIIGIDEFRPPAIRKEPYINLYFKLTHKAPEDWCLDFNRLVSKKAFPVKIEPSKGLFIETWVRKPEEIEPLLDGLKKAVTVCNQAYIDRILAQTSIDTDGVISSVTEGEQGRLNRIIAGLNYD